MDRVAQWLTATLLFVVATIATAATADTTKTNMWDSKFNQTAN